MSRKRILYVLHNHPALARGGSEAYTMQLYEALRDSPEFEPMIIARGTRGTTAPGAHGDGALTQIGNDPNQALLLVEDDQYDKLFLRTSDKAVVTQDLENYLRSRQPDVVHIQHLLYLGCDVISAVRRVLPDTPIVYTLHEYLPICNHYGQMLRTNGHELCLEASPRRCNECFPEFSPQTFFLRERLIKAHFSKVDLFIAPSQFLLDRYVDWGIPPERIRLEEHGFPPANPVPSPPREPRNRFAFFGVLTPFKGVDVLLRAMEQLGEDYDGHVWVHGANYRDQPEGLRRELERLFEATRATVTHAGPYEHADLPRLMAAVDWVVAPSIWWENSPLVIQESFQHGRPVICSNIGGMAEKVEDGVSGLHFNVGDPSSLADTIRAAATTPGLWQRLAGGIPPVRTISDHVGMLTDIYLDLIAQRRGADAQAHALTSGSRAW
jgi:glycosyltransferase involved in cell wall biosynthesis